MYSAEVLEVFVQPAQAHKVYNRLAPHPGVLFAAFDGGIALLGNAGFVGMVIWRWPRPTGALASCLPYLILWGRVLNPAVVQGGYVTNLRREVLELQSSVDDLVVVLSERQRCLEKVIEVDLLQTMTQGNGTLDWAVVRFVLMQEEASNKDVQSQLESLDLVRNVWQGQKTTLDKRHDSVVYELANSYEAFLAHALREHEDKLVQNRQKREEIIRNISSYKEHVQKQEKVLGREFNKVMQSL